MRPRTHIGAATAVIRLGAPDTRVMTRARLARRRGAGSHDFSHLRRRRGVAHGVLFSLLMGAATSIAGCIVPVPLEQQTQAADRSPVIAKQDANPPFGPVTRTKGELFEFVARADDPDLEDLLYGRLLWVPSGTTKRQTLFEVAPLSSAGDADHPARRVATFPTRDYCALLNAGTWTLSVVISDLAFKDPISDQTDGLADEALWVLTCN